MRKRPRLEREDWERAALDTLSVRGLSSVTIESLAAQLEVTKGSFYWHFEDRDALLTAALARWEREATVDAMALLDAVEDPAARLAAVLRAGELGGAVDAALLCDATDARVAPVLSRVTALRLRYTARAFAALGLRGRAAEERALLAYAAYVGHFALQRAAPKLMPRAARAQSYTEHVVATLVPRPTRTRSGSTKPSGTGRSIVACSPA